MTVRYLIVMSFFAEMEMRRERVFKQMNQKEPSQNQKQRGLASQPQRLGKNLHERRGKHEARTQRQEVFQEMTRPLPADDEVSAQNVGRRRRQSQDYSEDRSCLARMSHFGNPSTTVPEKDDVAFLHDVVLPFQTHFPAFARRPRAPRFEQIIAPHNLSANEPALDVGMNHARRFC